MSLPRTYVFTGGGTGGHLFPGIAVAQELQRRDPANRIVFVGTCRTIEATIFAQQGFEHRVLPVESLPVLRRNPFRFLWRNWQALRSAKQLLKELSPSCVIGLGGYASAPIVWAAYRRRFPVILLEQNAIPGLTTRVLSHFAKHVCVTFTESRSYLPKARDVIVTGNAVREQILQLHEQTRQLSSPRELLVLGGSQGADSLNAAVLIAVRQLRDQLCDWKIVHQSGSREVDQVRTAYCDLGLPACVESFFHDLPLRYATASLVISRAGASTLTELACVGTPMILLPYPHAADNHQLANARVFADHGAALIVVHQPTAASTAERLVAAFKSLVDDPAKLSSMSVAAKQLARPQAVQQIADVITRAADHLD